MDTLVQIGKRIKKLREEKKQTQETISAALHIPRAKYAKIEAGLQDIKTADIVTLCDYFEVSTDYLLGRTALPSKSSDADIKAVLNLINETNTDIARLLVKHGELASALHINK